MSPINKYIFLVIILVVLPLSVYSSDGNLDLSFNGTGIVTTDFGNSYQWARKIAIQSDNKIVVVGCCSSNGAVVARYNEDGSLDNTFAENGVFTLSGFGPNAVKILQDGKIILAGSGFGVATSFVVVRLNSDGSLDTSFGEKGIVQTTANPRTVRIDAYDLDTDSNGNIVVVGMIQYFVCCYSLSPYNVVIAKYNSDGSLDTNFNKTGIITPRIGFLDDWGLSAKFQSDGKIVVSGNSYRSNFDFFVSRYNKDGTNDDSFGRNGKVVTSIGSFTDWSSSMRIQPNGKIVVSGSSDNGSNRDFSLARYNSDGSLDTSFGSNGKAVTPIGNGDDQSLSSVIQADGKIVVSGSSNDGMNINFAVVRYNQDGSIDNSWGNNGKVLIDVSSGGNDYGLGVTIDSFGRVVVSGSANNLFGIVRLTNSANLRGKVLTQQGRGISNASVNLTSANGESHITTTNQYGHFNFADLPVAQTYTVSVSAKRYQFKQNSQTFQLSQNLDELEFISN